MSLILDALKRAERERKLEKAPDLSVIYQEGHPNRRKYHAWFWMGTAFLAAFVVLVIVIRLKEPTQGDIKDKTPKSAPTASVPENPLPPKDPPPPLSIAKKPVNKAAVPPPVSGGGDKHPKIEPKSGFLKAKTPMPQENGRQPPGGAVRENVGVREKIAAKPVKQFVTPRQPKDRPKAAVAVVPSPQPRETLPSIAELPEDIQFALDPLDINVHMYSSNPLERRVFINMQGYREGDTIGESGFRLVEITPNGVVVDYGKGKAVIEVKGK